MLGYLPQHLEQNELIESAEQTSEPPYLAEIDIRSAVWPSGERWERREAKKETDSETDEVELERHTLPRREKRHREIEKLL